MIIYVAVAIVSLFLLNKKLKAKKDCEPSAPPPQQLRPESKFFSGRIISGNFYYGENILKVSDIRLNNVYVRAVRGVENIEGKIILSCGDKEVLKEKLKNGWVNAKGFLAYNTTLKLGTKSKKELEYTIYYK